MTTGTYWGGLANHAVAARPDRKGIDMTGKLTNLLRDAVVGDSDVAVLTFQARCRPAVEGERVFPPTFPIEGNYLFERRVVEGAVREAVVLDQVQSQANRVEESLEAARRRGVVPLPVFVIEMEVDADRKVELSSLAWPHRYADAYGRDSQIDGVPFDKSEIGRPLRLATTADASALFARSPESLVFGAWDSQPQRPGRQSKFPRVYRSEMIGLDPVRGDRAAGRIDPFNLEGAAVPAPDGGWTFKEPADKKTKGQRLSERGLGNIAPNRSHGGVTITEALRLASLSFAALRRLGFGDASEDAQVAARTALAALAILGDRLAFGGPSIWLRSGSELVVVEEQINFVKRGGEVESISVSREDARQAFTEAVEEAARCGLAMATDAVTLRPSKSLEDAIRYAFLKAGPAEETG